MIERSYPMNPVITIVRAFALTLAGAIFLLGAAVAQQPAAPSPLEAALGQRVMAEVQANVQANAMIVDLQRRLAASEAHVKALEDKYEPKKPAPAAVPAAPATAAPAK